MITTYKTDATAKFLIMCDIEKRAIELTNELKSQYTFCASIVGYRFAKLNVWRVAKDAGFVKEADGRWIGFTTSYNGEGGAASVAYEQALREKKNEIGAPSFLDHVSVYEYLT